MTTKKFVSKYQGRVLQDDGCYKSEEFKQFARDLRSTIKEEVKKIGATLHSFSIGHYDVSGFVERDGRYAYFSYSEPRHMPIDLYRSDCSYGFLVRTAEGPKDYRGGLNRFCNIFDIADLLDTCLN